MQVHINSFKLRLSLFYEQKGLGEGEAILTLWTRANSRYFQIYRFSTNTELLMVGLDH